MPTLTPLSVTLRAASEKNQCDVELYDTADFCDHRYASMYEYCKRGVRGDGWGVTKVLT